MFSVTKYEELWGTLGWPFAFICWGLKFIILTSYDWLIVLTLDSFCCSLAWSSCSWASASSSCFFFHSSKLRFTLFSLIDGQPFLSLGTAGAVWLFRSCTWWFRNLWIPTLEQIFKGTSLNNLMCLIIILTDQLFDLKSLVIWIMKANIFFFCNLNNNDFEISHPPNSRFCLSDISALFIAFVRLEIKLFRLFLVTLFRIGFFSRSLPYGS